MRDIGVVKIHCLSEAMSPITHMAGTSGNESIINKEKVFYNGMVKSIPVISGNALRHKMVRDPGAMFLVDSLGLRGALAPDQANYMFYGGSLTESSISQNTKAIGKLQELFPLFRMLGGSLRNQIVAGSMSCMRGIIICQENKKIINSFLPSDYRLPIEELKSADEFIRDYQYTRGDIQKRGDATELIGAPAQGDEKSGLMIYNGQTIIPGTLFYHGFILNNVSRKEVGALFLAMGKWQNEGGIIGGYSRIGHGRLNTSVIVEDSQDFITAADLPDCIQEYVAHVEENKEACIEWLNETFPERVKKEKGKEKDKELFPSEVSDVDTES